MLLNKQNIEQLKFSATDKPAQSVFNLPERVLQFGTGVLLRGLPDYFIDKANRMGVFNGRILIVKSTGTGTAEEFIKQDGLYTLFVRGVEEGKIINQAVLCAAVSRVLSASEQWQEILRSAENEHLQIVISNTTEVGIQLVRESIFQSPPVSFPAKLLAFLHQRYLIRKGSPESGMVIIPTELIPDNGKKLSEILNTLAHHNGLDADFIQWLSKHNQICSSLVDRIVPGKPDVILKAELEKEWGYGDGLITVCEPYRLWAIEGDEKTKRKLTFHLSDSGIVIVPDITKYRELKLRMLNATHSLSCGLAYLSGYETVKAAMEDSLFEAYIRNLMMDEIGPSIPYDIAAEEIAAFGSKVLERFRNPYLEHAWLSITMQFTSKLNMRVIPLLYNYYLKNNKPPELMAMGFAAYLLFMRPVSKQGSQYFGMLNSLSYPIQDKQAPYFYDLWASANTEEVVNKSLSNEEIWNNDLTLLEGFADSVTKKLKGFIRHGTMQLISAYCNPVV